MVSQRISYKSFVNLSNWIGIPRWILCIATVRRWIELKKTATAVAMAAPFPENIKFSFQQMKRTDLMKTVIAKSHNRDIDFHFVYFCNAWCVDALSRMKKKMQKPIYLTVLVSIHLTHCPINQINIWFSKYFHFVQRFRFFPVLVLQTSKIPTFSNLFFLFIFVHCEQCVPAVWIIYLFIINAWRWCCYKRRVLEE